MDRETAGFGYDRECGRLLHIVRDAGTSGLRFGLGACHDRAVLPVFDCLDVGEAPVRNPTPKGGGFQDCPAL